jgi:hypothetical protein
MTAEIVSLALYRTARADRSALANPAPLGTNQPRVESQGLGGMLSRQEQRRTDHRIEPRHVIEGKCVPALTLNGGAAILKNISRDGLMAAAQINAAPGSRLLVTIAGCRPLSAQVIWSHNGLMGLEVPIRSMELAAR